MTDEWQNIKNLEGNGLGLITT